LEIIVSVNGCNVPNYVQSEGNAKFRVNFRPREAAPHNLSVRFNGEPVPGALFTYLMRRLCVGRTNRMSFYLFVGSPFTCKIFKSDQIVANEDGLKMCHVNRPATITIDSPSESVVCKVTITAPNGRQVPIDSTAKTDDKILTKFTPTEVGK
jgi:filamin